ncbi:hypothetical protein ACEWY4_002430 [Coilia grayii]|uniref:UMOD/GP2/OIT3-like D8C domain-containing protein n=1 Tax=Coilia grayii TaxID=363190 RepID=A0ABD1KNI9_9TELE
MAGLNDEGGYKGTHYWAIWATWHIHVCLSVLSDFLWSSEEDCSDIGQVLSDFLWSSEEDCSDIGQSPGANTGPTLGQHWGQHGASTGANTGANKGPALGQHGANTGPRALCVFALFLSTYQATSAQQSDPCYNYTVLNDTWRATTNTDQSVLRCDGTQVGSPTVHWQGWYLLVHQDHSVRMPESCVPINRCSTHAPIWLNGSHPSPADGVVTRQMCGHWTNGCCHFQPPSIQVKACPGNYTVYEFVDPFHCYLAYCADFSSEGALPSVTKHVVGVRLQVSSAERLNETAVEEQILKPLRDLLRQRGVDVSGIRLRRLVEKQP